MSIKSHFNFYILFFCLNSFLVNAGELYQASLPPRCLAMGGTCITQIRGSQALFLNASTLARVEGFDITLVQAYASLSSNAENYVNAISNNSGNTFSLSNIQELYGKTIASDVGARSSLVAPYFGIGAYSSNYLVETFNNPTYPNFNVHFISDYGYTIGAAIPLGAQTSFGIAGRSAKRWGGDQDIEVMSLLNSSNSAMLEQNFTRRGSGTALDLSFITTLNSPNKPTFSIVWLDVGTTQYKSTTGTLDPPSQSDNLIFGASVEQNFLFGTWTHAFEYKFIRTNNEDITKKIHLGTEVSYGLFDLRAGISQGYVTYGFALDLWFLKIEAATFSNELGTYAGQDRNERYQVGLTFELDFDQSFKLNDLNGKKRRLKQRR